MPQKALFASIVYHCWLLYLIICRIFRKSRQKSVKLGAILRKSLGTERITRLGCLSSRTFLAGRRFATDAIWILPGEKGSVYIPSQNGNRCQSNLDRQPNNRPGRACNYTGTTCDNRKKDILFSKIFLPANAPPELYDLQRLCDAVEASEIRRDARTARLFIGSLPNELPAEALIQIVIKYVDDNFTCHGLCAIAAIHIVKNKADPAKDNPHVHLIVPTRTMSPEGFLPQKNREWDKRKYVTIAFSLFSQHISIPGGEIIGRKSAPVQIIVHYPQTETGRQELARRVASVHADAVNRKLQKLTCPTQQKRQLVDAVIQSVKEAAMPQSL